MPRLVSLLNSLKQQENLSLVPPLPGEALQEQNLKAALDSPNIYVETTDNDGNPSVVEIEREVRQSITCMGHHTAQHHAPKSMSITALQAPSSYCVNLAVCIFRFARLYSDQPVSHGHAQE